VRVAVCSVLETLLITFPPAALYKQTGRCEVTTTFIAIALFCYQTFSHSRSLIIVLRRNFACDSASAQE
jgi:hypothetical protein